MVSVSLPVRAGASPVERSCLDTAFAESGKLLVSELYGVQAHDFATFATTLLSLGAIGMIATLVPALRALRVNPVVALRNE